VDAPLTLTGLSEELHVLLGENDFEGAEEILSAALVSMPQIEPFLHFQLGRVYSRWNKMSSSLEHLGKAAELARSTANEMLMVQVIEEMQLARRKQAEQAP
jgi:hypothetical protein